MSEVREEGHDILDFLFPKLCFSKRKTEGVEIFVEFTTARVLLGERKDSEELFSNRVAL